MLFKECSTRQCSYCFVFLYDREFFDGLDAAIFRAALSAETGVAFGPIYTPLSHSELYYPHTKKRHQLSADYLNAIRPDRWSLPAADKLWQTSAVQSHWPILGCPPEKTHLLADAISKIYENRAVLLKKQARP